MRIVYLTPFLGDDFPGITNKLADTTGHWRSRGHEVEIVSWAATAKRVHRRAPMNFALDVLTSRRVIARVLALGPDIVVLRHYLPLPGLTQLCRRVPVILDVHNDDMAEFASTSRSKRLAARVNRRTLLGAVAGATFVTPQAATSPAFAGVSDCRMVVGNSVNLEAVEPPTNERPVISLAVGAALPWQGLDIVEGLAAAHPEFEFHVLASREVTPAVEQALTSPPANLQLVTCIGRDGYLNALARSDIALGVLALGRAGRSEASPLKVRDAAALGIPVLLPYLDPTFLGVADPCIAMSPAADGDIGAQSAMLTALVPKAFGGRLQPQTRDLVSVEHVEDQRLDFFESVAGRHP